MDEHLTDCSSMMKEKSTSNHRKRDDDPHHGAKYYPLHHNTKDQSMKINLPSPSSLSSSSLTPSYSSSLSSPPYTLFNIIICILIIQISYDLVTWIDGSLTYIVSSSSPFYSSSSASLPSPTSSPPSSLGPWLSFLGAEGFALYNGGFSDPKPPSSSYSSSDSWVSEELWPKEKSLIHIKLIKPLPKEIPIWELRNKDNYLSDLSLDFDSPYRTMYVNNCVISFKSYYDGYTMEPNNQEIVHFAANIQVQISGGHKCVKLPLSVLTPLAMNLTHLVVRDTGILSIDRFLFGANRLDKLIRLDLIGNTQLNTIQSRAFDGLPRLNYLSIMNNRKISDLALETFAGLKNLEELIYIGNDDYWDQAYFANLLLAVSDKILPNLIHLHLCGSSVNGDSENHQNYNHDTSRIISTAASNLSSESISSGESIGISEISETNKQEIGQKDGKSAVINDNLQVNNNNKSKCVDKIQSNESSESGKQHNNSDSSIGSSSVKKCDDDDQSGGEMKGNKINTSSDNSNYDQKRRKPLYTSRRHPRTGIKINKNDFSGLTQIKYLQLSDCDINYIHPSAVVPLIRNIVGLNLGGNPKLRIDNLKSVLSVFYMNNLKFYRQEAERLTANSTFLLQRNNPVKIGLDKLDLSYTINTPSVPKDLLTVISKTSITELYLKKVSWKYLREGDIPPMPNLRVLHIDHSQIEEIDEKAFSGLEELIKLSLRGNYIKEIPLFLLEPLRKLEYLDLSGFRAPPPNSGQFKSLQPPSSTPNPDDEEEYDADAVLEIPRKAFVHGTHLKEVNLSYKNLQQLPRYLFIGLFKLEKLHLRGCNLKYIEYLTFFPLKSIVYIDLSENNELISNVRQSEEDTFVGLEAVEMIRLSDCNLTSDDINDFNVFRRMHEHVHLLDLSHNHIDSIQSTTLQNFSELRHIDLSHNHIRSWQNYTIFSKNSFITTLDISHNQITHITPEMLGDFRNLKNLSFALNPLQCECDWEGPLLLLDQKQKKGGGHHIHHQRIQDHIEQLVHRQQEIVSTAFASSQAPPKSIIEWLNTTTLHFLHDRHPLRSDRYYFCHPSQSQSSSSPPIVFKEFFRRDCPNYLALRGAKVSAAVLALVTCALLLLAVFLLVIAFIYNSTIRKLLTMVDDDFLHNYQYDAFVSYNVNDSDWVFNKLLPNLEEMPAECHEISPQSSSSPVNIANNNNNNNSQSNKGQDGNQPNGPARSHIKLCVYDRDFIAGRPISECITESIKNSRKVILVISNNFARSPWCRFETDLAHSTLMDQNREGLILIKLEEMSGEIVEQIAPQIHFLLKTRIYLSWSSDQREQDIFWRKLRRALGFAKSYGTVKQYYKNYVGALYKDRRQSVSPNSAKDDDIRVSFRKIHDDCDNKSKFSNNSAKIDPQSGNIPCTASDSVSNKVSIETPSSMCTHSTSCGNDNVIANKYQQSNHDFRMDIDCDQPTGIRKDGVQKVSDSKPMMPSAVQSNLDHHHSNHQHHQNDPQGSPNELTSSVLYNINTNMKKMEKSNETLSCESGGTSLTASNSSSSNNHHPSWSSDVIRKDDGEVVVVMVDGEEEHAHEQVYEEIGKEVEEKEKMKDKLVDSENNLVNSREACTKCLREQLDDLQTGTSIGVNVCQIARLKEISNRIGTTCDRHHNDVSIFDVSKKNLAILAENGIKKQNNGGESIGDTLKQISSSNDNDNHDNEINLHSSSDIELKKCKKVSNVEDKSVGKKDVIKLEDVGDEESDLDEDDHHREIITDSVSYNHDSGVCCYKKKEVKVNCRTGNKRNVFTIEFDCEQDDADDENLDETDQESTSGISINDTGIHDCGPHCRSLESATDDSDSHRNISSSRMHHHQECRQNHHHGCFHNHHRQLDYRSSSSASISPSSLSRSRLARSIDNPPVDRSQLTSRDQVDGDNVQNSRDIRFAGGSVNIRQKRRRRTRGKTRRSQSRARETKRK